MELLSGNIMKKWLGFIAAVFFLSVISARAATIEGTLGNTGDGEMTYRLGAGFPWERSWLDSDAGRLTGYWDAGYTFWEGGSEGGDRHLLSFSPVLVYEFDTDWFATPFVEAGIGAGVFSGSRVGDRQLGSLFQFENRIGFGLRFRNNHKAGFRAIHYSNAGIQDPNSGIGSYSLFYSFGF